MSGGDTVPPVVTASESGTSGTITLSATASDNIGVTKVEFYVDNALTGTDTATPFTMTLASSTLANSGHVLTAKAFDAA
ncbi:Ig-like domain-containing protein [Massilia sp. B-10]|nr:Ig-like domain-containing protein [Massilia sp. B-10]UUZ56640.1 Ig-like domain-containing protein [Massilia sp. H-1]